MMTAKLDAMALLSFPLQFVQAKNEKPAWVPPGGRNLRFAGSRILYIILLPYSTGAGGIEELVGLDRRRPDAAAFPTGEATGLAFHPLLD